MKDWVLDHAAHIYLSVWAALAFGYGYLNDKSPNDKSNTDSFGAVIFGLWPIGAFFVVLLSPLWVPTILAEVGACLRKRGERKAVVNRVLTYAHMKKCDNCGKPGHDEDCRDQEKI